MTVYLLGAGPGDPGLLTLRGAEVLAAADVVVYDRLSVGAVLDMAPAEAERINVGKLPGQPRMPQEEINQLLVEHGLTGRNVVRLKGGDPLVFARGGEEAAALAEAGVDFEIIPGITSAFAAPAYAGIPVTLRHSSTSVTVITGHEASEVGFSGSDNAGSVNWEAAAKLGGTLLILMGVARWDAISKRLLAAGMPPETPAAAVCWGTRPKQRTTKATLATLGDHPLEAPSVIVVGEVAAQDLAWFENRPLFGKKVAVTRPIAQSAPLCEMLARAGAQAVSVPLIGITEAADQGAALKAAAARLNDYDWIILTSANGARALLSAVKDARDFGKARVAAIGPATAEVLRAANIRPDLVPRRYVAEALLDELLDDSKNGNAKNKVLIARAAVARDVLPEGLRAAGWEVETVEAYRTKGVEVSEASRAEIAGSHVITFASPSAVQYFAEGGLVSEMTSQQIVACIGPITAAEARKLGLEVAVEAPEHTAKGLVEALEGFFA